MRKIIMFNLVTLDGFFAGEDGNIDWHNADDEFNKFGIEQTSQFGALIFGRTTYELFESYWPKALTDPATSEDDRKVAQIIDDMEKIVFSTTLDKVEWKNTKLFKEIIPAEVKKLKEEEDRDMAIFGSGTIVAQMASLGLIDEYRFLVNPIVLGKGKSMFKDLRNELNLKLINTRTFGNGNVLLCYVP